MPSSKRCEFYSNGRRKIKTTKRLEETTRDRHLFWNDFYSNKNFGLWIECTKCKKWRKSFQYSESHEVPDVWYCSMNKCEGGVEGSCEDPEEDTDEDYLEFCPGSLVWAKLDGYPWWPAMVDEDPDIEEFFWNKGKRDYYHVTFLDENVSRAWIRNSHICSYLKPPRMHKHIPRHLNQKKYNMLLNKAEENANVALEMTLKERLRHFSFAHVYKGKFPRAYNLQPDSPDDSECITADALLKEVVELDAIDSDLSFESEEPCTLEETKIIQKEIPCDSKSILPDVSKIERIGSNSIRPTSETDKKENTSCDYSNGCSKVEFFDSSEKNFKGTSSVKKRKKKILGDTAHKKCNVTYSPSALNNKPSTHVDVSHDEEDTLELVIASNETNKIEMNPISHQDVLKTDGLDNNLVNFKNKTLISDKSNQESCIKSIESEKCYKKKLSKKKSDKIIANPSLKVNINTKTVNNHQCPDADEVKNCVNDVHSSSVKSKNNTLNKENGVKFKEEDKRSKQKLPKKRKLDDLTTSSNFELGTDTNAENKHQRLENKKVEDLKICGADSSSMESESKALFSRSNEGIVSNIKSFKGKQINNDYANKIKSVNYSHNAITLSSENSEINALLSSPSDFQEDQIKSVERERESMQELLKEKKIKKQSELKFNTNSIAKSSDDINDIKSIAAECDKDDTKILLKKKTSRIMSTHSTSMAPKRNFQSVKHHDPARVQNKLVEDEINNDREECVEANLKSMKKIEYNAGSAKPKKEKGFQENKIKQQKVKKALTKNKDVAVSEEKTTSTNDKQIQKNAKEELKATTKQKLKPSFKAFKLPLKDTSKKLVGEEKDLIGTKENDTVDRNFIFDNEKSHVRNNATKFDDTLDNEKAQLCSKASKKNNNALEVINVNGFVKVNRNAQPEDILLEGLSERIDGCLETPSLANVERQNKTNLGNEDLEKDKSTPKKNCETVTGEDAFVVSTPEKEIKTQDEEFYLMINLSDEEF